MNIFESINESTEKGTDLGEKYLKTTYQYVKLKFFQQLTISMSMLAKMFIIGGLLFIGLIFTAVSSAIWIGNAIGNPSLGYLIVGGIFIVFALIVYFLKQHVNRIIITKMSEKFFDKLKS